MKYELRYNANQKKNNAINFKRVANACNKTVDHGALYKRIKMCKLYMKDILRYLSIIFSCIYSIYE